MKIENKPKTQLIGFIIIWVVVIGILFLPISIPYSFTAPGKLLPSKEWIVTKAVDGRIMTQLIDNSSGITDGYRVTQFERGDAAEFVINSDVISQKSINQNDSVAFIYSNTIQMEMINLEGELAKELAKLEVYNSSDKQSVIDEAQQQVNYAKKQYDEELKIFERQKILHTRKLISTEEFDISKGKVDLYKINISIAQEKLNTVSSGSKVEDINLVKANIKSIRNEIQIVKKRLTSYTITSPINGSINEITSRDTLLFISNNEKLLVYIPIRLESKSDMLVGQHLSIKSKFIDQKLDAKVIRINRTAQYLNGNAMLSVVAELTESDPDLLPWLFVQCEITAEEISLREYVLRYINNMFI